MYCRFIDNSASENTCPDFPVQDKSGTAALPPDGIFKKNIGSGAVESVPQADSSGTCGAVCSGGICRIIWKPGKRVQSQMS